MAQILIVDDDSHIREVVRFALTRAGHTVHEAADGQQALALCAAQVFDAVVLDIVMPEEDGLEVCRKLRARSTVPILFLSSRDDELDRILGLELGADDYLTKPFSPRELVARVKAILRRVQMDEAPATRPPEQLQHGPLRLDLGQHRCYCNDTEVVLTLMEFNLVATLLQAPGRAFARDALVDRVWGAGHAITDRAIDTHVKRIRKKFEPFGLDPVETVYGLGYRLRLEVG